MSRNPFRHADLRTVVGLALWPVLENTLRWGVEACDTFVAGHQPNALAAADAVGVTTYLDWFMGLLQSAMGIGATALIARATGARHFGLARKALGQALLLGLACGCVSGLVGLGLSFFIGPAFHLKPEATELAARYLRIAALAMPFSGVMVVGCAALRGSGDTRTPLLIMLGVNAVNVLATASLAGLVREDGGRIGLGLGVPGIAAGTGIAYACGAAAVVAALASGRLRLRLHWHRLRPHWETLRRIVRVGLPLTLEFGGMMAANYLLLQVVARLPYAGAIGAHIIVLRVESLCFLPGLGLAAAAATLVGQSLGRRDPGAATRLGWICAGLGAALMTVLALPVGLLPGPFTRLFTHVPEHLDLCPDALVVAAIVQPLFALQLALGGALRGAGDTRPQSIFNAITLLGLRLPLAWWLGLHLGFGLVGVWTAMMLELGLRACFVTWRFRQGGWTRVKV